MILKVLLAILSAAPQLLQLLVAIISEVHTVQTNAGLSGADKSQHVIDKVTPIADVIGVEVPHVQELINGVVDVSKALKVGAFAGEPSDQAGA